jgi:hypothetical protein
MFNQLLQAKILSDAFRYPGIFTGYANLKAGYLRHYSQKFFIDLQHFAQI